MQIAVWVQSQSYRAPREGVDQHVSWTGTRSLTGFPLEYSKLSLWGNAGRGSGTAAKNLTRVFAVVGECFTSTSEQIFGASTSRQHFFNVTIFFVPRWTREWSPTPLWVLFLAGVRKSLKRLFKPSCDSRIPLKPVLMTLCQRRHFDLQKFNIVWLNRIRTTYRQAAIKL